MDKDTYLAVFHDDSEALAAAARLGLREAVPSCPGWSVADLVVHTGAVHRAQANIVRCRAQEPMGIKREMFDSIPGLLQWLESSALFGGTSDLGAIPAGLVEWFEQGAAELEAALREADPAEPVWSWSETKRVAHYLRMMPIETAVHRWDAQLAHGRVEPIGNALALDGIDQTFDVMLPFRRDQNEAATGQGESYLFLPTDGPGEWHVRFEPARVVVEHAQVPADVTIRAAASDLFLFLWQRIPASRLQVEGDDSRLDRYFELVPPI